jgi:pimeloyl-ACP methyl ester carboxylesterase
MPATLPRRAYLGAVLPEDERAFTDEGIWIEEALPDTMAAHAGLVAGDRLVSIAGVAVRTLAELRAALRLAGAHDAVEIEYERGGARIAIRVSVVATGRESIEGAAVEYGELDAGGARLRTIATRAREPRGLVVTIQGIACETVDAEGVFAGAIAGWTTAGYDTLRYDKRGVGDSEGGPCPSTDFETELADARHVLEHAKADAAARGVPLVVFGHSVGGIIAAVLAGPLEPAGVIVYGNPVMRWLACLKDSTRRQLVLRGTDESEIVHRVAALDALKLRGELNGRSAAYHAQLDQIDIEGAWRRVACPILVVRGEYDWVVDAADQARIATLAPGATTIVDVASLDHLFGWHADREASLRDYGAGAMSAALTACTLPWLDQLRSR